MPEVVFDFGICRPSNVLSHKFSVRNPYSSQLILRRVRPSCSCSSVRASVDVIEPGDTMECEFSYKTPASAKDDRQSVFLEFEQSGEPVIVGLTVTAQIRHALTVDPAELAFGRIALGYDAHRSIRVENYSESDWSGIEFGELPPNLTLLSLRKSAELIGRRGLRQAWNADFELKTTELGAGTVAGRIAVSALCDTGIMFQIPVSASVIDGVTAFPSVINFGRVRSGEMALQSIQFRLEQGISEQFQPSDVIVTNDTDEEIQFAWTRSAIGEWKAEITWTPTGRERFVHGKLRVKLLEGVPAREFSFSGAVVERRSEG